MHRLALRSLVLAATALLLTTSACDAGDTKADGGKKAEDVKKADDAKKADEVKADDVKADAAEAGAAEAGAPAAETGGAEAGAETGETGGEGETGEAAPAAGEEDDGKEDGDEEDDGEEDDGEEDGGDKPDADKPDAKPDAKPKIDGKPLYEKKCKSCHGLDGKGDTTIGKKVDIPSLSKTKLSKGKIVSTITNGVADTKMKAYKEKLSKDEIDAIAAYVKKL